MPGLVASSCPPPNEELTSAPVSPIPALSDNWKAWNEFVEATPETGFMQSSWWVDFRNTCGFENFGITLKGENGIAGGAVVLKFWYAEDSCFYYIQDGPVLPCDDPLVAEEIFGVILNETEERRETEPGTVSHLRIEPRWLSLPSFGCVFRVASDVFLWRLARHSPPRDGPVSASFRDHAQSQSAGPSMV